MLTGGAKPELALFCEKVALMYKGNLVFGVTELNFHINSCSELYPLKTHPLDSHEN